MLRLSAAAAGRAGAGIQPGHPRRGRSPPVALGCPLLLLASLSGLVNHVRGLEATAAFNPIITSPVRCLRLSAGQTRKASAASNTVSRSSTTIWRSPRGRRCCSPGGPRALVHDQIRATKAFPAAALLGRAVVLYLNIFA